MSRFFLFIILLFIIGATVSAIVAIVRYFGQKNAFYSLATFISGSVMSLSMLLSLIIMDSNLSSRIAQNTESYGFFSGLATFMLSSPLSIIFFIGAYFALFTYVNSVISDIHITGKSAKDNFSRIIICSLICFAVPFLIWLFRF